VSVDPARRGAAARSTLFNIIGGVARRLRRQRSKGRRRAHQRPRIASIGMIFQGGNPPFPGGLSSTMLAFPLGDRPDCRNPSATTRAPAFRGRLVGGSTGFRAARYPADAVGRHCGSGSRWARTPLAGRSRRDHADGTSPFAALDEQTRLLLLGDKGVADPAAAQGRPRS